MKHILLLSFLILSTSKLWAQTNVDTTKTVDNVIVKMKNGDEFKGVLVKKDQNTVLLKTENGELNLITSNVISIEKETYNGKFRFANVHDTRYFFGPTGIPIKQKKGYYQNVLVTTNFFNLGITKNISIGGGFEFLSSVLGHPIWFLTPKIGFDISKNVHVAGGVIMAGFSTVGTASLGYGVITFGSSETNLSLGAGYGYQSGHLSNTPAIMISGTHRLSNNIALLSENYIISNSTVNSTINSTYFGIQGIRILSPKNSFDIGAIVSPQFFSSIPALPFVGYARAF
jgi:small nuclear ribonucleoprotein (snRNP)-like protein